MREQTSLIKEFDETKELVSEPQPRKKREGEYDPVVVQSFKVPERNWEGIIADFNASSKRKFPFTALQCKVIIEYVKRGIPAKSIFRTLGYSIQAYTSLATRSNEAENLLAELVSKDDLTEAEFEAFNKLLRNPYRLLFSDINRAEGLAELFDWEQFNEMSRLQPDVLMAKMRAKYKEVFSDKDQSNQGVNIQINLGGDWIAEL